MKIIFLCGSLEPGRDGVGDYICRLSVELFNQGHYISIISLNDYHISEAFFGYQELDNVSIAILRLPSVWKLSKRFAQARKWIYEFNPDWLSLQFVPFTFHKKGLPFFLGKHLRALGTGRRWHIMFHELWVGIEKESSIKHILWGKLQKQIIHSLIFKIQPKVIHTQTLLYKNLLAKTNIDSIYLPLFSNIPNVTTDEHDKIDLSSSTLSHKSEITLVIFGTIQRQAPVVQFAHEVSQYAQTHNISMALTIVGRCGEEQERWIEQWESVGLTVNVLGEQTAAYISAILSNASFGITTNPALLIGKSGTVAAMQEHGLPIICVTRPWNSSIVEDSNLPAGVYIYSEGCLSKYFKIAEKISVRNILLDTVEQLLNDLSDAS